ncbi:unnamed protein product [Urochloa humidicola]
MEEKAGWLVQWCGIRWGWCSRRCCGCQRERWEHWNNKRRKRFGDVHEEENGRVSLVATKLEARSYRELQGLAKSRRFATNGSNKDVTERLLMSDPANATDGVREEKRAPIGGVEKVEEEV